MIHSDKACFSLPNGECVGGLMKGDEPCMHDPPCLTPKERPAPRQEFPTHCPDCGAEYTAPSWACLFPYRHPARAL